MNSTLAESIATPVPPSRAAFNPWYAVMFFANNGMTGFLTLGAVFLVVTGGEALYADLGHFGISPIRRAWFFVVFPALLLNYLGQGALLLNDPGAIQAPFFHLAPDWMLIPLVLLSTAATIIASQAVISATFFAYPTGHPAGTAAAYASDIHAAR